MNNRIIFGTGSLHHLIDFRTRQKILSSAYDIGFRSFDTAPAYGNGISECELGIALLGKRDKCEINTKFGIDVPIYPNSARYIFPLFRLADRILNLSSRAYKNRNFSTSLMEDSVNASLKRLKTDYIDTLFIHEPIFNLYDHTLVEIKNAAAKLIQNGKIRYLGVAGEQTSLNKCNSLAVFDVIQTKLDEIKLIKVGGKKKIITYNVYKVFIEDNSSINFNDFLRNTLFKYEDIRLIVATLSVKKLKSLSIIFE